MQNFDSIKVILNNWYKPLFLFSNKEKIYLDFIFILYFLYIFFILYILILCLKIAEEIKNLLLLDKIAIISILTSFVIKIHLHLN